MSRNKMFIRVTRFEKSLVVRVFPGNEGDSFAKSFGRFLQKRRVRNFIDKELCKAQVTGINVDYDGPPGLYPS